MARPTSAAWPISPDNPGQVLAFLDLAYFTLLLFPYSNWTGIPQVNKVDSNLMSQFSSQPLRLIGCFT